MLAVGASDGPSRITTSYSLVSSPEDGLLEDLGMSDLCIPGAQRDVCLRLQHFVPSAPYRQKS